MPKFEAGPQKSTRRQASVLIPEYLLRKSDGTGEIGELTGRAEIA